MAGPALSSRSTNGGSAQELGIVLAAYGVPRAASMVLGGWLSDRLRPRRLMLFADTIRMPLVGLLIGLVMLFGATQKAVREI